MLPVKHLLHCGLFFFCFYAFGNLLGPFIERASYYLIIIAEEIIRLLKNRNLDIDPIERYGYVMTYTLYALKIPHVLAFPFLVCTFFGLFFYNAFPGKVTLKKPVELLNSFVCMRIMTRGDFPNLVKENAILNMKTCQAVGLEKFCVEVVTAKEITNFPKHELIRQTVVPLEYGTQNGSLFKARQLHYCMEKEVNFLRDDDWIVHLDEDSVLTENAVRGIVNFVQDGRYKLGQGLITFNNDGVVNSIGTMSTFALPSLMMGAVRFTFSFFHKPLFGWAGSFQVCQVAAEREVSYDHGVDGSVMEDVYFAIKGFQKGFDFNFVEGEMWEQSPLTFRDYIEQRKRWTGGMNLIIHCHELTAKYKFWLLTWHYALFCVPIYLLNVFLSALFPLPYFFPFDFMEMFCNVMMFYIYVYGLLKIYNPDKMGIFYIPFSFIRAILSPIVEVVVISIVGTVLFFKSPSYEFYVVKKQE